jgi:hypothetical protein
MDSAPAYLRGGHIMARRERARRSTAAMAADPITLVYSSWQSVRMVLNVVFQTQDRPVQSISLQSSMLMSDMPGGPRLWR